MCSHTPKNLKMFINLLLITGFGFIESRDIHVLMTEVFEIVVDPPMFNWTYEEIKDQYVYQASMLNAPDLPSWMNFVYSSKHHTGFLYGVPPKKPTKIPLEIVALNKKNYETRIEKLNVVVSKKMRPARYEVHIKIDNVNVEDIFDVEKMDDLKNIFREHLWKNSEKDLYVTFLSSAVKMGARKPLIPSKEEGIVVRLGSFEAFSMELQDLQEEVRPLWKVPECPRDFKRTSVERIFRDAGFTLDWCSFRLIYNNNSGMHQPGANEKLSSMGEETLNHNNWYPISKSDLPQRSYFHELLISIIVPIFIMIVLASILSFILCFHHDDMKHLEDMPSEEINQFAIQRATETLRNLSKSRDMSLSPDLMLLSRSHTNSPTSTISRGVHCRPSPPPYVRPKFKPEL